MTSVPVKPKRFTISMLDMSTYRQSFIANSAEQALEMAHADEEESGLNNWNEVTISSEFDIINEEDIT